MNSIQLFNTEPFIDALKAFFEELKVPVDYLADEPAKASDILGERYKTNNEAHLLIADVYALGMVNDAIFEGEQTNKNLAQLKKELKPDYDGLLIFGIILKNRKDGLPITRSHLAEITRAFNRTFPYTPVTIIFKYENLISFANSERIKYKQEWREGEKVGKVIMVQDIDIVQPHSGHVRILLDLTKPNIAKNYKELLTHWNQVLDVNILNKKFFSDLSNWYFWAMNNVSFPDDLEKNAAIRNATNLIRLITRVVFIWFIKEKSLVPDALFSKAYLDKILKDFNKNKKSKNYYHAILQNLFFGTLNQKMDERKFAKEGDIKTNNEEYGVKNLFRYADLFTISEKEAMQLFKDVPFLNGGLFDCLDKPNEENKIVYIDGFSRNPKKQAIVPDYIFFGEETEIDLNDIYATKNKKYKIRGLINLLESYKFTVEENTPLEEEIALDPELLGKVFENLLASYNPETQTTARKQTGSFYTPREIVNYMVDESLLEYIKQNVNPDSYTGESENFEPRLRELISYAETPNPFDEKETKALIESINNCKILDPACGSGAYPMGILHKMVHLLQKLDPENKHWKALQRQKAMEETEAAFKIGDKEERGVRLAEINDVFENNASDYGRKLYLIENCIYGIDIQPIAVQISKLRFFISLIIDQNKQATKENFGIRSLPNLETKFVAANTLIGLDKPAQTLLRNPEIEVKENQLKELRHKYFTANTRKEKLQYQKKDKKLRQEIAKMLESDGWQTGVAKQIVAFDPYDQNKFANWFEAEWMFGSDLHEGFDIIIGNPPWGAKLLAEEKNLFKITYPKIDSSTPNTFSYFVGWAFKNYKSVVSFVLPDSILIKDFAKTRGYIKDFVSEIIWYENTGTPELHKQFVYVDHDVCVINIFKRKSSDLRYSLNRFDRNENKLIELKYQQAKSKIILEEFDYAFNLIAQDRDFNLLNKFSKFEKLDDFMQCHEGIHTGNSREILFLEKQKNKFCKPLFYGGGAGDIIRNYQSKTSGWYVDYRTGIIDKSKGYYASLRDERIFKNPKIYITRTGNPFKAFYDEETYASNNFFSLQHIDYTKNTALFLKYILPFIISKPAQYFIRTFAAPRLGSTFIETKIFHLLKFRIPKISLGEQIPFNRLVDYVYLQKSADLDTTFFERIIDAMVYELYLPEEIKTGGAEVLKHLNTLPELKEGQDEKNLKTIEMVYKELSDPKHPISAALLKLLTIEEVNIIEGRK